MLLEPNSLWRQDVCGLLEADPHAHNNLLLQGLVPQKYSQNLTFYNAMTYVCVRELCTGYAVGRQ